jgi:GxxExxY protein
MENPQKWAIVTQKRKANDPAVIAEREAKKVEREAKKVAREQKKLEKEMERQRKAAEKERKSQEKKTKLTSKTPKIDMVAYEKLDMLRKFAQDVYASLGAGHLESIYHAAMAVELRLAGMMYESEQVMPVMHKGHYVGIVRADIIVNKECVLEFKISGKMDDAKQQARQYMKLQGIQYGYVVMFPKTDGGAVQFVDARE